MYLEAENEIWNIKSSLGKSLNHNGKFILYVYNTLYNYTLIPTKISSIMTLILICITLSLITVLANKFLFPSVHTLISIEKPLNLTPCLEKSWNLHKALKVLNGDRSPWKVLEFLIIK